MDRIHQLLNELRRLVAHTGTPVVVCSQGLDEHAELNKLHGTDEEANAGRKPP